MSSRDSFNNIGDDNPAAADAPSVVLLGLDRDTQGVMKLYLSLLHANVRAEISDYSFDQHDSIMELIGAFPIDVCFVDFDMDPQAAIAISEQIHQDIPQTAIFAVSSDSQPEVIIQAMRSGCSEYLFKPLAREQLMQAMDRVGARRRDRKEQSPSEVMTFIGAKGGCGVTTLATQLGTILAKTYSRRTLLLDFHPNFGDAALYLGFKSYKYHSFGLIDNTDRLDAALMQSLVLHHASGLDMVPAPDDFDTTHHMLPTALAQTFTFLRHRYDFILIDLPPGVNDQTVKLLSHSDHLYLITVAEVPALRNVARIVDYMAHEGIAQDKLRVVLNRFDKRSPIPEAQIEKVIRQKLFWNVPNQYHQAVNMITSGSTGARDELTRNLTRWAEAIGGKKPVDEKAGARKKRGGILGMFGGSANAG